ncbi:unnamed protein product [Cylicocyclus nassatus]|uniref:Neurotransmitter-gated ion-channel ligand-binding domain-containing protein n=1 Tax=Cylicocyclus nassatus TaxID=53992 RepID=A0AA36M642_CYLNA|nr:unnamed protein product [Cylicocyclus nassatus]
MYATVIILGLVMLSDVVPYENETRAEFHKKQAELISHLFSGYRKEVPPIIIRGLDSPTTIEPLVVNITLGYVHLMTVNEPNQTIDMLIDYILRWNDVRLTWNPADFNEIKGILIDKNLIWKADLLSSESCTTTDVRESQLQHAYVECNGNVHLYVANAISLLCPWNVENFPFDEQVCNLTFASIDLLHPAIQFNANISEDYKKPRDNGAWTVYGPMVEPNLEDHKASFHFQFKRSPGFYVIVIIMPSFLLTFLCVIGMFRFNSDHTDYLGKLGAGFTAIVAKCSILQLLETSAPKASQLSLLSFYVMVNLILVTVAMFITVMSLEMCSLSKLAIPGIKTKRWTRRFRFNSLAKFRVICLILFPLATTVNLLKLLLDVRKCMNNCKPMEKSLVTM